MPCARRWTATAWALRPAPRPCRRLPCLADPRPRRATPARRRQPRILRDRQKRRDQRTRHENGQGDNPRKNRSIDEKRRHTDPVDSMRFIGGYRHSPTFAGGRPGQGAARGLLRFTRWTAPGFHASCVVHTIEPVEPRVTTQAGSRPGSRQSLLWLSELWKSRRWGFVQASAN